jgi:hypothetical protein
VPQAAELVFLDCVRRVLFLVASVAGIVLIFRRSASTPRFYQGYFGACVLYALLMFFAANNARMALDAYSTWESGLGVIRRFRGIPTTSAWASTHVFVQANSTALLWGDYWSTSQRVARTFASRGRVRLIGSTGGPPASNRR